jgi:hypothetical protein
MKDLKQSTKQRFGGLDFDYPETALEVAIVTKESGVDGIMAEKNATKNGHIQNVCSMCIKINKVGKQEVGI